MGRLILDTAVLVAVERRRLAWSSAVGDDDDPAIAAITAAEMLHGAYLAEEPRRSARATQIEQDLGQLLVEPYEMRVARAHAELLAATTRAGRPRGAHDLIIAATARATGRTVVTLDRAGFDGLPGVDVRTPRPA